MEGERLTFRSSGTSGEAFSLMVSDALVCWTAAAVSLDACWEGCKSYQMRAAHQSICWGGLAH